MRSIAVIGMTHRTAPIEVREGFALDELARKALATEVQRLDGVSEVLVLSTCNRSEIFVAGSPGSDATCSSKALEDVFLRVGQHTESGHEVDRASHLRSLVGQEAVVHVLSLASGIDSMILGETQILGQVRTAFGEAVEEGMAGPVFRRLFPASFKIAKRAHSETNISRGAASVGSVAVELAAKVFDDLSRRTALLIGAGETGQSIARALQQRNVARLWIAGRGMERSAALADELGAHSLPLEEAVSRISEVDVVLAAASPQGGNYVVDTASVRAAMGKRRQAQLLIIDVGVPRNVQPSVADLSNVFLYGLDDLRTLSDSAFRKRQREVPRVLSMVEREVEAFHGWWSLAQDLDPLLRDLHGKFEELRTRELDRTLPRLPEEAKSAVEIFSRSLIDKLLQEPTRRLKEEGGDVAARVKVLRELFGLEEDSSHDSEEGES